MKSRMSICFHVLVASAVVATLAVYDASAQTAMFDFGRTQDAGANDQPGWNALAASQGGTDAPLSVSDGTTGWGVTLFSPNFFPSSIARDRGEYNSTLGGTFTLDDVYIDFIGALETLNVSGLSAAHTYDVQFIMFDDNAGSPVTQTVTNITGGASDLLGDVTWPAAGDANLTSDLDFSVFGTSLTPDVDGNLDFFFTNSNTGDRSFVNGLVITGGPGGETTLFDMGRNNGEEEQAGWNQFVLANFDSSTPVSIADPVTGIVLTGQTPEESSLIARTRSPYDATLGGTFSLDSVYIDAILAIDNIEITDLDPSKQYDIQFIMYDDNVTDGRTQAVFNTTTGVDEFVGLGVGPGAGGAGASLNSNLDFSVFATGLTPNAGGTLSFRLQNTATGDRSLVNGIVITEIPEPASALLVSLAGVFALGVRARKS